ncbi:unnamed protein product [Thlaspi arvense]|uniref:Uncharacterized protein n=1 Tax=Thlaspi arvense TaxID=13288 RepID=A0AAU9T7E7_THLAR|nr:unnamed protein product [Thlaspi arvense]
MKDLILTGSIPVTIKPTIDMKDVKPLTLVKAGDDGTLVTQTPTGERANGHASLSNEATKEKPSGVEENGNPLLVKPNVNKGKGIASSSGSVVKGKTKIAADPVANASRNETSAAAAADTPIWFTLLALKDQDTDAPLPQLHNRYLRVRNGNLPVSYIQKYIAMKLRLESEDEVELYLGNVPLVPSVVLCDVLTYWIAFGSPHTICTTLGASAADYIIIFSYGRKLQPKPPVT